MSTQVRTGAAYGAVTTLFFAWGFITALIDPLIAAVKGIFTLSDFEAQLSAFAFFIAYGLVSFPAAVLLARRKSVPTILIALSLMVAGCLLMLGAANLAVYPLALLGLFVLASGITILQVAANPLAAALGRPEGSHFRLTLSQMFNSVGTFIAPVIGASLFLEGVEVKAGTVIDQAVRQNALVGIDRAYFWICGMLLLLIAFFRITHEKIARAAPETPLEIAERGIAATLADAWRSRWARLGGLAIFLYVGAEVAIGSQMAFFLNSDAIWGKSDAVFVLPFVGALVASDGVPGISLQDAGRLTALYWGGAMVGRAIGSALLARFDAARLLLAATSIVCAMCVYIFSIGGVGAGFVALAIGLFNSIMFPVIFTLTLERSTASKEATSGFLCTAIIGGAFIPLIVGAVSAQVGYATAYIVPAICYAAIGAFAWKARATSEVQGTIAPISVH